MERKGTGSGLRRIVYIDKDGQLNFGKECVENQNFSEILGPFTKFPENLNSADLSSTPDWLPIFRKEKPPKENKR